MRSCEEFRDLIYAYALGALDLEERADLESHLATGCVVCTESVKEGHSLVSHLAYLAPGAAPPPALKDRLMQIVRAEALESSPSAVRTPLNSAQAASRESVVREFLKSTRPIWMGIAALIALSLYFAWDNWQLREQVREARDRAMEIERSQQGLQAQLELTKHELNILSDPTSVKIALVSQNPNAPKLEAIWNSQLGLLVTGQQVPIPQGNRVLQLWLVPKEAGAKPVPSLTQRPDPDGKLILMVNDPPNSIADTKALAISEEPAGGSPQPTTTPRWVGGVT